MGQEEWQYPHVENSPFSSTGGLPFSSVCVTHQGWGLSAGSSAMVHPVQETPSKINGKLHSEDGSGPDIVEQDAGWVGRPEGTPEKKVHYAFNLF